MSRPTKLVFGILAVLACAVVCLAQERQPAKELLYKTAQTYRNLSNFHFVATELTVTRSESFERKTESHFETARDETGRWRVAFDDGVKSGVEVFDGETTWVFSPQKRQYTESRGASPARQGDGSAVNFEKIRDLFLARYRALDERIKSAEVIGEETLELDGRRVPCTVVKAEYSPPPGVTEGKIERTYWISQGIPLVVRELSEARMKSPRQARSVEVAQTVSFRAATANDLPDHLFVFEPPADATRVESFEATAPEEGLVGQPAPDFTLRDFTGEPFHLQDQRGKVVLLDFWASWCAPCRIDLPRIETIHREWKSRGLVVWGINSESPDVAREFLRRQNYTFPALVDEGQQLARLYQVAAIPTVVVISKDGQVAAYLVGSHPEAELRKAIREAGLE